MLRSFASRLILFTIAALSVWLPVGYIVYVTTATFDPADQWLAWGIFALLTLLLALSVYGTVSLTTPTNE